MYQCYVDINMTANFAFAFIYMIGDSTVEECYSIGNIVMYAKAVGFAFRLAKSFVYNCYTDVQIDVSQIKENPSAIYSFIQYTRSDCVAENICIYGDIVGTSEVEGLQVLLLAETATGSLINCHVYQNAFIDAETFAVNQSVDGNYTLYQNIEDMYNLSNILNKEGDDEIWIDLSDEVTKLKFQII